MPSELGKYGPNTHGVLQVPRQAKLLQIGQETEKPLTLRPITFALKNAQASSKAKSVGVLCREKGEGGG